MMRMIRLKGPAGYTMVEVVTVAAIIGILAAIGIPSFNAILPRIRLSNDASVLSNQLSMARVRAISKSAGVYLRVEPDNDSYIMTADGVAAPFGERRMSAGTNLYNAGLFVAPDPPDPPAHPPAFTLNFAANGQVVNVPLGQRAFIELRTEDGNRRKRLFVEPTGRVQLWRWDGTWVRE